MRIIDDIVPSFPIEVHQSSSDRLKQKTNSRRLLRCIARMIEGPGGSGQDGRILRLEGVLVRGDGVPILYGRGEGRPSDVCRQF